MFLSDKLNKGGGASSYQISRSLRFNSADSAYLSKTWSGNGSRTTATASFWVKKSSIAAEGRLIAFDSTGSGTIFWLFFNSSDQLQIYVSGSATGLTTTQVFRDPSAWYHIVVGIDTTQATGTDRIKLYVNGSQITAFTGTQTYYSQNATIQFNNTSYTGYVGFNNSNAPSGYMTELNWIDGTQLTPSSFGETNAQTGVWQPKAYSGSYGTNGFYLNFSDNSNTTAATLGKDYSGNGNNWTPNNFSVTAGVGNDSLVDSPTSYGVDTGVGGTVRGNYATLNPLNAGNSTYLKNGNLDLVNASEGAWRSGVSTIAMSTGKWYVEITVTANSLLIGIDKASVNFSGTTTFIGGSPTGWGVLYTGQVYNNSGVVYNNTGYSNGDIIGMTFDADTGVLTWYKNNVAMSQTITGLTSGPYVFGFSANSSGNGSINFGQRPFAYTAPSGFKALCTQNLPTPTIGATTATQANKYFDVTTYTGNGSSQSITNSGSMQPDLVWGKNQASAVNHGLIDSVRGVSRWIGSNVSDAEGYSPGFYVTAFNSNGFTAGNGSVFNTNGEAYVAWQWKANGSGSTNTSGSITSTVSANTTSGFSVLTYTGTGTAATIGHGLGVAPSMLIFKSRSNGSENWNVYHKSLGASTNILLNSTIAAFTDAAFLNATAPTSTVLSVGGAGSTGTNQGSATFVCYAFAEVAGYSKFGSYTGNGSTDGPFVFTGMRPAYIMFKRTNSSGTSWNTFDTTRSPYNVTDDALFANLSNAEAVDESTVAFDILSNGFKLRTTGSSMNGSGDTYIFMAFASAPFKYSLAR